MTDKNKTYYITTPIYYTSGELHLGNCYTTVICDAIARFKRMDGYDVCYLTGTDEHGLKVETAAKNIGKTPKEFVDKIVDSIHDLWKLLDIKYDKFIRTTDDVHINAVGKIFRQLYDQGDLYKGAYEGLYCTPCESFWTASQLVDGKCPDCGREVKEEKEEAYFFRLSAYTDKLLDLYKNSPDFISPKSRMNEMINNFLKPGLTDLCVSRTTFKWGIPVSFDDRHVVYVWVDALSSYISGLGFASKDQTDFDKFWPADLHMVGKEIVRFHTIIWPAILMALKLPLPKQVYGHGWLMLNNDKMSKSKGNGADPYLLADRYGIDAIRYFLLREIPFGNDGNYTIEIFLNRINSDLCNSLGNLISRTTAMIGQYFDFSIPAPVQKENLDDELISMCEEALPQVRTAIDSLDAPNALATIFRLINRANKYIDETAPWLLAKEESKKDRLATVLYNLTEVIRTVAVLLCPFIPQTSQRIFDQLQLGQVPNNFDSIKKFGFLNAGKKVIKGAALYPRIDVKAETKYFAEILEKENKEKSTPIKKQEVKATENVVGRQQAEIKTDDNIIQLISIDDFAKVQLKTAKIIACEKIERSNKLLKLQVQLGGEVRTVVSGLALHYQPQQLINKTVILVTNLKPAKLCGIESNGMVLCASSGEKVIVLTTDEEISSGSSVS